MDDTVYRRAAIDAANDWLLDCFNIPRQNRSCGLIRRLEDLPSAQPERKKGKWISRKNEPKHKYWWTCSECQGRFDYEWKFCPNCGADMRGER